jgi:hypothetical protein
VQQAERALVGRHRGIVGTGEEVGGETEPVGQARQDAHAHRPGLGLEPEHGVAEARQQFGRRPQAQPIHVRAGDLVGLFLIGGARRGPDLGAGFPAGVELLVERDLGLFRVGQGEERLGHGEGLADLLAGDAVIDDLEEADLGRGLPQLPGDLALAPVKVAEIDDRYGALAGFAAQRAHVGFLAELVRGGNGHVVLRPLAKQKTGR